MNIHICSLVVIVPQYIWFIVCWRCSRKIADRKLHTDCTSSSTHTKMILITAVTLAINFRLITNSYKFYQKYDKKRVDCEDFVRCCPMQPFAQKISSDVLQVEWSVK